MKTIGKALKFAVIIGSMAYLVSFAINFMYLLAHQPPHTPDGKWPQNVTSAPPSVAWFSAIPAGVITFVGTFFVSLIILAILGIKNRASKNTA
jgi:hypothetical protein